MPPALALELVDLLNEHIRARGSSKIPVHLQVLGALRFFAEGSYQKGVSQDFNHAVSQSTFSRCLQNVIDALSSIAHEWIKFPQNREEREHMRNR